MSLIEENFKKKLLIVVPYRNRDQQLKIFQYHTKIYFNEDKLDKYLNVKLCILEQANDKPFNYGRLCNAGYLIRGFYLQNRVNKSFRNNRFEAGLRIENPKNIVFGNNSYYGFNCKIYADKLSRVKVGSNVTFNSNVMVNARGKGSINIGVYVLIGPNVVLRSCNHSFANLDEALIA